ncbi:hypothetical protein LIER_14293 [Lithospermum erythrorhizon]|uniref:Copia protein n=1 Tax=Lithospermum erythrorhizon TaxID=34254 RepID=A0AAV3Q0W7_LITER
MQHPTESHWREALHVVKYLKGTSTYGLLYANKQDAFTLSTYSNRDWAKCPDTRKLSSEAKYRSAALTVCELKWLSYILNDMLVEVNLSIPLYCDKKSAIFMIENPVFHERTKHIELDCHIIRDHNKEGFIKLVFVPSKWQLGDIFTKVLPAPSSKLLLEKISFHPAPS